MNLNKSQRQFLKSRCPPSYSYMVPTYRLMKVINWLGIHNRNEEVEAIQTYLSGCFDDFTLPKCEKWLRGDRQQPLREFLDELVATSDYLEKRQLDPKTPYEFFIHHTLKECTEKWILMSPMERKPFTDLAEKRGKTVESECQPMSKQKDMNSTERNNVAKPSVRAFPKRPVEPLSPQELFHNKKRRALERLNPEWSSRRVEDMLNAQWFHLTEKEKNVFVRKSAKDKKAFDKDIAVYEKEVAEILNTSELRHPEDMQFPASEQSHSGNDCWEEDLGGGQDNDRADDGGASGSNV